MNKFQRRKSKEVHQIMARDKFGLITYTIAKRIWRDLYLFNAFSPCENCDNNHCFRDKLVIAYCPNQR